MRRLSDFEASQKKQQRRRRGLSTLNLYCH